MPSTALLPSAWVNQGAGASRAFWGILTQAGGIVRRCRSAGRWSSLSAVGAPPAKEVPPMKHFLLEALANAAGAVLAAVVIRSLGL